MARHGCPARTRCQPRTVRGRDTPRGTRRPPTSSRLPPPAHRGHPLPPVPTLAGGGGARGGGRHVPPTSSTPPCNSETPSPPAGVALRPPPPPQPPPRGRTRTNCPPLCERGRTKNHERRERVCPVASPHGPRPPPARSFGLGSHLGAPPPSGGGRGTHGGCRGGGGSGGGGGCGIRQGGLGQLNHEPGGYKETGAPREMAARTGGRPQSVSGEAPIGHMAGPARGRGSLPTSRQRDPRAKQGGSR